MTCPSAARVGPTGTRWDVGYQHLLEYVDRHDDTRVAQQYRMGDLVDKRRTDDRCGLLLGKWVHNARQARKAGRLSTDKVRLLDDIEGWVWNTRPGRSAPAWEARYAEVAEAIASGWRPGDGGHPAMVTWLVEQRRLRAAGGLTRKQRGALRRLPGWPFDRSMPSRPGPSQWLAAITVALSTGVDVAPDAVVDGLAVGVWAARQRDRYAAGKLSDARVQSLEAVPGWSWTPRTVGESGGPVEPAGPEDRWQPVFDVVAAFYARHGRVPAARVSVDGVAVGAWVVRQRRNGSNLTPERRRMLESLPGWSWSGSGSTDQAWMRVRDEVAEHAAGGSVAQIEPQVRGPVSGVLLAQWVRTQRRRENPLCPRGQVRPGRVAALESLPGWSW